MLKFSGLFTPLRRQFARKVGRKVKPKDVSQIKSVKEFEEFNFDDFEDEDDDLYMLDEFQKLKDDSSTKSLSEVFSSAKYCKSKLLGDE